MAAHNKKGRSKHGPPFVQLPWYMLDCAAWRALSTVARAAFVEVARVYNGSNNGKLAVAVRGLAQALNCSKDTASRALKELEDKGFIRAVTIGAFSLKVRHASEYQLTLYRDDRSGHLPTKDFMRWIPPDSPTTGTVKSKTRSDHRDSTVRPQGPE